MEKTYCGGIKHFRKLEGQKSRSPDDQMRAKSSFGACYYNVPDSNFSQLERLIGAALSISKNLITKGQRSRSLNDQM